MERRGVAVFPGRLRAALTGPCLLLAGASLARGEGPPLPRSNAAYVEAGGSTILGANYERLLSGHASIRVGVGVVPVVGAVPAVCMPNLLVGSDRRQLELGLGVLVVWEADGRSYARPTAAAGYRYTAPGGLLFRAGVGVAFFDGRTWVTPGVSLGRRF
ncbi:MAG TPA: hypothetical protein VLI67_08595 [Vicinamibacteria bacterium]|nr:hypothetical protein [Vicinamibacteria bacterium]